MLLLLLLLQEYGRSRHQMRQHKQQQSSGTCVYREVFISLMRVEEAAMVYEGVKLLHTRTEEKQA